MLYRSEARTVPPVLRVAPIPPAEGDLDATSAGDAGGYYADGAYTAAPTLPQHSASKPSHDDPSDPQEAYYVSLLARVGALHHTLLDVPPLAAIQALDDTTHPLSLPKGSKKATAQWRRLVQMHTPRMAQLACMDLESVLGVLGIVRGLLGGVVTAATTNTGTADGSEVREKVQRLGAWCWGCLARCRDVGELGSEEVGELRELGKRAVGVLVGLREGKGKLYGGDEEDEIEEEQEQEQQEGNVGQVVVGEGAEEANDIDLETAKVRLQARLGSSAQTETEEEEEGEIADDGAAPNSERPAEDPSKASRAMLDLIITIVGEVYGQRDLLEFRDLWDEDVEGWA